MTTTTPKLELPQTELVNAIRKVSFARDSEGRRWALNCVLVEVINGTCYVVATDGRRLAYAQFGTSCPDIQFLVPKDTTDKLCRMRGNNSRNNATFDIVGNSITMTWTNGRGKRVSATWDNSGRFPKWQDIVESLPKSRLAASAWIKCRADVLARYLAPDDGILVSLNGSVRLGKPPIDLSKAESKGDLAINFDRRLLCDWIETIPEKHDALILLQDSDSAAHCLADGAANFVIMPLASSR